MSRVCPACGSRPTESKTYALCGECYSMDLCPYGDEPIYDMWMALRKLHNGHYRQAEMKMIADSAAGSKLAEDILKAMEPEQAVRLLKRIT